MQIMGNTSRVSNAKAVSSTGLLLNIVPVAFSGETLTIGRIGYTDEDAYRKLREGHWQTHAFRFDPETRDILNVSIVADVAPIGSVEEVELQGHLLLAAKAIQHSILVWLSHRLQIVRGSKQLVFWGQADEALLLTQALRRNGLQPIRGLEVPIRYEVDCRLFSDATNVAFLGLIIDVSTTNVIDIPIVELMQRDFDVQGSYVCRRRQFDHPYLQPGLETLGRVSTVQGASLMLTDSEGIDEIDATEALLEPRLENLERTIMVLCGRKAPAVLQTLEELRQPIASAPGKLAQIRRTLMGLKKREVTVGGLKVELGELLYAGQDIFPPQITTERPTLLFGSQGRNTGSSPDAGIRNFGPYMYMQHTRNAPVIAVVCEAQHRGRVEQFMKALCEGFPDDLWTDERYPNPYRGGLISKFRLARVRLEYQECSGPTAQAYRAATRQLLQRLPQTPDLAVVQIRDSYKQLRGDANPYLVTKSAFMTAGVPTQSVKVEHLDSQASQLAYLLNNMALATYAKLDGIPWVMSSIGPTTHELVIGIGSSEVATGGGRLGPRQRYVGITTVFQGDGRYLVWGLTREAAFEDYPTALLESLRTVVSYVQTQHNWQYGERVRLVFHVYKRLKDSEVAAVKSLVSDLVADRFTVEYAFLDISWSHPYRLFDTSQRGAQPRYRSGGRRKGEGLPERGTCLQLDRWRALLQLTGPTDVKTETQGLPVPLLVELHRDSDFTDLTYLMRQIYHMTYLSWRSFFPATEPVTIKYSRLIAVLLGNLKAVTGWDSTVLSVGALRGRRWFL